MFNFFYKKKVIYFDKYEKYYQEDNGRISIRTLSDNGIYRFIIESAENKNILIKNISLSTYHSKITIKYKNEDDFNNFIKNFIEKCESWITNIKY